MFGGGRLGGELRELAFAYYRTLLQGQPAQGKTEQLIGKDPASNHFVNSGKYLRFCDVRWIYSALLDVLRVNAHQFGAGRPTKCRRCGYPMETLPHILSHCPLNGVQRTYRHNAIVNRILRVIVEVHGCRGRLPIPPAQNVVSLSDGITLYLGRQPPVKTQQVLKPDITLVDDKPKSLVIIDVTVPFENGPDAFDKYQEVRKAFAQKGYRVFRMPLSWVPWGPGTPRTSHLQGRWASLVGSPRQWPSCEAVWLIRSCRARTYT